MKISFFIFLLCALPTSRAAACDWLNGYNTTRVVVPLPVNIAVPADAPVWSVVGEIKVPASAFPVGRSYFSCGRTWIEHNERRFSGAEMQRPGKAADVLPTGLDGLGVVVTSGGENKIYSAKFDQIWSATPGLIFKDHYRTVEVRFYKTSAALKAGAITAASMPDLSVSYPPGDFIKIGFSGTGAVMVSGCVATPTANSVDLGVANTEIFRGIGSKGKAVQFGIRISGCGPGINRVAYQLDPIDGVAIGDKRVMNIKQGVGAAEGIGLQLTRAGLGSPALGEFGKLTDLGATSELSLAVEYYQTAAFVKAGAIRSSLQFTIQYL